MNFYMKIYMNVWIITDNCSATVLFPMTSLFLHYIFSPIPDRPSWWRRWGRWSRWASWWGHPHWCPTWGRWRPRGGCRAEGLAGESAGGRQAGPPRGSSAAAGCPRRGSSSTGWEPPGGSGSPEGGGVAGGARIHQGDSVMTRQYLERQRATHCLKSPAPPCHMQSLFLFCIQCVNHISSSFPSSSCNASNQQIHNWQAILAIVINQILKDQITFLLCFADDKRSETV